MTVGFNRRLLVTGAGGQLGRAFGRLAPDAVLLDRHALDVADRVAVLRTIDRHRPDVIVHAAAYTKVDQAEVEPDVARSVNAVATENVAEAAGTRGALLVYPSTDYVFSGDHVEPYREDDEPAPLSVYGKTKLEGERASTAVPDHLIVRTSWVFGEGRNFVQAVLEAASKGRELRVVDDQRGRPTYALDLAAALIHLVEAGGTGIFHVTGGGSPATWADIAEGALVAAGIHAEVIRVDTETYSAARPGPIAPRPPNSVLNCARAETLGVRMRPWQESLGEYVQAHLVKGGR